MINERRIFLVASFLVATSLPAHTQGTYSTGVRSGYGGTTTTTSPSTSTQTSAPSGVSPTNRNGIGTGQGRTEGALGMTPQLQRELGIGKQQ